MQPAASSPTLSAGDWGVILLYLAVAVALHLLTKSGREES